MLESPVRLCLGGQLVVGPRLSVHCLLLLMCSQRFSDSALV